MTETNYFDSSALVKHYFIETGSTWVQNRYNDPAQIIALSDIGRVEIAAAFASKLRGKTVSQANYQKALEKLAADTQQRYQILSLTSDRVDEAITLTTRHKLRGYDAVHLACALFLNQALLKHQLDPVVFVSADNDLLAAAQAEGLAVENPNLYS
ncbi:MAG: type II toxin-antitoxin system VapC family toxin [Anaerolineaceae bacterium]|nr:type II toxin-antitoxin system VapC family toxin [Anaerolineaceae bacterium]